jgi:hypothetical protein
MLRSSCGPGTNIVLGAITMSTGPETPAQGQTLFQNLQTWFSQATSDYNQVHKLAKELEADTKQKQDQSVVVSGFQQTILNRYHGITNLAELHSKAKEGAKWTWYFCLSPTLNQDIEAASKEWVKSKLAVPTFDNVKKVAATTLGTSSKDFERIKEPAKQQVKFQTQAMGVSLAVSAGISSLLKQVGTTAKSEITRNLAMKTRTAWQVTGVLAIAYGLGKIDEAMRKSGPFEQTLRKKRDDFVVSQTTEMKAITNSIKDACGKGVDQGWK